jgi:hypothetical protein
LAGLIAKFKPAYSLPKSKHILVTSTKSLMISASSQSFPVTLR